MTSSLLFDPFISNIQEIIDIERLFELISMFLSIFMYLFILLVFLSSLHMIRIIVLGPRR